MQLAAVPTVIETLHALEIGDVVTFKLCTSDANIFLKKDADGDRFRFVPSESHLRETTYFQAGSYMGIEQEKDDEGKIKIDCIPYAILLTTGQCAVLDETRRKVLHGCYEERQKVQHVPVWAIKRVIEH